jgi:hypothetical protein
MESLGDKLTQHTDNIVKDWYDAWRDSVYPHMNVPEAALKDKLPQQLRVIGEQIKRMNHAEEAETMWKVK